MSSVDASALGSVSGDDDTAGPTRVGTGGGPRAADPGHGRRDGPIRDPDPVPWVQ